MSDVILPALTAMHARRAFSFASSANGLVSVKLHRIRDQLETKLSASLKGFDEAQRRHAKQGDAGPIAVPGSVYLPSLTPAYEPDEANASVLDAELSPILAELITFSVAKLTAKDLEWVTAESGRDIGEALSHFTDLDA